MLNLAWKTLPRLQSPRIALLLESETGENDLPEEENEQHPGNRPGAASFWFRGLPW